MYDLMDPNAFKDILIFHSGVLYSSIYRYTFETILMYVNNCFQSRARLNLNLKLSAQRRMLIDTKYQSLHRKTQVIENT